MNLWGIDVGPLATIYATLVSSAALWLSWRNYRREAAAELPIAEASIGKRAGQRWPVYFSVLNRSDASWTITEAVVVRPRGAKLIRASDLLRPAPEQPWRVVAVDPPPPEQLTNRVTIDTKLMPAGRGRHDEPGNSDRHGEWLSVFVPSSARRINLSMRIILCSNEAARRSMTITIKRTAVADAAIASD